MTDGKAGPGSIRLPRRLPPLEVKGAAWPVPGRLRLSSGGKVGRAAFEALLIGRAIEWEEEGGLTGRPVRTGARICRCADNEYSYVERRPSALKPADDASLSDPLLLTGRAVQAPPAAAGKEGCWLKGGAT
jgi:hypothetical protein